MGATHLGFAFAALIAGALVPGLKKGNGAHRKIGYAYFFSMLAGFAPAWRRSPGWQARHARFVTGSYVGLCAAAVAETCSHFLALPFGPTVIISFTPTIVAGLLWMRISLTRRFKTAF